MKKRLDVIAFLIISFSMTCFLSALDIKEDLHYFKSVPAPTGSPDLLRIVLDSDIYDSTGNSLEDIRILDGKGSEIPYILKMDKTTETEPEYVYNAAKTVSLKKLDDNRIEICIEIPGDRQAVSGLTIRTPSKNFEKQVTVEGSPDMSAWNRVSSDQTIFDYSEVTPISNSSVKFPSSEMKYFRLSIANFSENRKSPRTELINEKRQGGDFSRIEKMSISSEHLKIDAIGFLAKSEKIVRSKVRTHEIPALGFSTKEVKGNTEITFSTMREPLDHLVLETTSVNFSRNFKIAVSPDGKDWKDIGCGCPEKITSIDLAGYKETNLSIPLDSTRSRHYRFTISNGDTQPLKLTGVKAFSAVNFLELINSRDTSTDGLSVYYGGTAIPFPSYDTNEILGKLKNPSFLELTPGAQQDNPGYRPGPRSSSFLNSKTLFTAAVILMVLILSLTLFKSFRKIESIPSEK
ncbi:MAG: hypothetical protein WAX69_17690 [Victivallales bacterium]